MSVLAVAFGQVLRQVRHEHGYSQEKLALDSGYHRTYISLLERGINSPSLETLFRLAGTLGLEPEELVRRVRSYVSELPPRLPDLEST